MASPKTDKAFNTIQKLASDGEAGVAANGVDLAAVLALLEIKKTADEAIADVLAEFGEATA